VGGVVRGRQFTLHLRQFSDNLLARTQEINEQLDDLVGSVKVAIQREHGAGARARTISGPLTRDRITVRSVGAPRCRPSTTASTTRSTSF